MDFIDEKDDIRIFLQLVDDRADTFLKLTTVFCSRHHRGHIKHHHALFKQNARNFLLHNTQCQTLYNGRFSDSWFTDKHRIVLLAAAQDLRQTFNLAFATHNRVQLAFFGSPRHVYAEIVQHRSIIGRLSGCSLCSRSRTSSPSTGGAGHIHIFFILFIILGESHSRIRIGRFHRKLFKYSLIIHPVFFQNSCSKIVSVFQDSQQYMFRIGSCTFQQTRFKHTHLQYLSRHRGQGHFSVRQESIVLGIFQETLQATFYSF